MEIQIIIWKALFGYFEPKFDCFYVKKRLSLLKAKI